MLGFELFDGVPLEYRYKNFAVIILEDGLLLINRHAIDHDQIGRANNRTFKDTDELAQWLQDMK